MVTLRIDNRQIRIDGASLDLTDKLKAATSYPVAGAYYSQAYRAKRWDGRQHLLKLNRSGYLTGPIGLLVDVRRVLLEEGEDFDIQRAETKHDKISLTWNKEIALRDYQAEAIRAFVSKPSPGRGILRMPIRSGKTKTAGGLIKVLRVRTLFVVPSRMLMTQTAASLQECFPGADIGQVGDGVWREGRDITVATIQTLAGHRGESKYRKMTARYGFVIFDEAHHLKAETYHEVMLDFDARFRLGLSATVFFDSKTENERGAIWLKAACGDIKYDVDMSMLIEQGHLVRQNVKMIYSNRPVGFKARDWSSEMQAVCLFENAWRNQKIADIARDEVRAGRCVMIVTNRMAQIRALERILEVKHVTVTGKDSALARDKKMSGLRTGHVRCIIGTVFGEGIDVPEVDVLINAEGGRDPKATIQRMRNMTPAPGKSGATLYDFFDVSNAHLAKHSRARLKVYKGISAFTIDYIGEWPAKHPQRKNK